jgi:hypothetical protein
VGFGVSDGDNPAVSDYLRPTDADVPDGVYRVVGTTDGVTVLRVGDADGRRVVTGEVRTVLDATGFEAAEPPGKRSVSARLRSFAETAYWSVRAFAASLVVHPLAALAATALLLAGTVVPDALDVPAAAGTALVFAGAFGLAYVGSGRLDS